MGRKIWFHNKFIEREKEWGEGMGVKSPVDVI